MHTQPNPRPAGSNEFSAHEFEAIYAELHRVASALLRGERQGHTLQTTALVNELYLRVIGKRLPADAEEPQALLKLCTRWMKQILVEHARRKKSAKRGGGWQRLPYDNILEILAEQPDQVVVLADLVDEMANSDELANAERISRIAEMRIFGGLTERETAATLEVSEITIRRGWLRAKAWLAQRMATD